jgi:hypothetical protein
MHIEFSPEVALLLETLAVQSDGMEFSGLGFVELRREAGVFYVYDFVPLDVGSAGWTEIPSGKLLPLYERKDVGNLKIWIHRHPVGNGIPGRHNWSGTDERTCRFEPLGVPYGMQDSVGWALAAVRTPLGWVGRYDTYGPKGKAAHIPVVPSLGQDIGAWVNQLKAVKAEALRKEEKRRRKDTITQLRRVVPFVQWDERASHPYNQGQLFNEEVDQDEFRAEWEQYLEEQDGANEEDELGAFANYFWGNGE